MSPISGGASDYFVFNRIKKSFAITMTTQVATITVPGDPLKDGANNAIVRMSAKENIMA